MKGHATDLDPALVHILVLLRDDIRTPERSRNLVPEPCIAAYQPLART